MADYDYKSGKKKVIEILDSKTEIEEKDNVPSDSSFTYDNGIKAPVASIFVDIRKSTEFFKNNPKDRVARIIRAFINQVVKILRSDENFRDLGIRGDCVFAVYSAKSSSELRSVFGCATYVNTFMKMFNKLLSDKKWPNLKVGIGCGYDPAELVIKAGEKGSGRSDYVWIGDAVIDASNCCNLANKNGCEPIVISDKYYDKIKNLDANDEHKYSYYFTAKFQACGLYYYSCDLIKSDFDKWINEGMKD